MKITSAPSGFRPITIVLTTPAEASVLRSMIGKTSTIERVEMARDMGYPMSNDESGVFHVLYAKLREAIFEVPL